VTATSEVPASFRSSSLRPGPFALVKGGIRDVLSRRRLIAYLVRADLRKAGTDTLLGNLWWVLDPLLQMLVYVIFVGIILGRGSIKDYPLFVLCAILPWKWFSEAVGEGTAAVVGRERLIKQIYFPKLVLPVATTSAGVVSFAFGLIPLFAITALFYRDRLSPWILLIPVVAFVQLVFSMAFGIFLSATNVFYRDVGNLSRHLLRMWFYLSPALYSAEQVKSLTQDNPILGDIFAINPWTIMFTAYRDLIYYGRAPEWRPLAILLVVSVFLTLGAILYFKRAEPSFAKVL
jgi:homopolymeric O-antigen transport system permease protein